MQQNRVRHGADNARPGARYCRRIGIEHYDGANAIGRMARECHGGVSAPARDNVEPVDLKRIAKARKLRDGRLLPVQPLRCHP